MWYTLLQVKRLTEQALMFPFIVWGKQKQHYDSLPDDYDLICFFPNAGIGGAEKVNLQVCEALKDKKTLLIFTKKYNGAILIQLFERANLQWIDISEQADDKRAYWNNIILRGTMARLIKRQQHKPVIFIGQCNFGYKMTPWINPSNPVVDLIHVSELKFSLITFPYLRFLKKRITIAETVKNDIVNYYHKIHAPQSFSERFQVITNAVNIPLFNTQKNFSLPLKIYYAGRGGYPKRIWLIMRVIEQCINQKLPVEFHLAGPFENEIPESLRTGITYHGVITSQSAMYQLHQKMDVLFMTSAFEGFPLVIQEAMANRVVPMVTAVNEIPHHITDSVNGILLPDTTDEQLIVDTAVQNIKQLCINSEQLQTLSHHAYQYASEHFHEEQFASSYSNALFLDN